MSPAPPVGPSRGDLGLLSPVWAGTAGAGLVDDAAFVQAMLDVERAWLEVCRGAGLVEPPPTSSPGGRRGPGEPGADASAIDASASDERAIDEREADASGAPSPWRAETYDFSDLAVRTPLGGNALIPLLADLRAALRVAGDEPGARGVHLGATSQDVVDTALMLLAARLLDDALPRLDAATDDLARLCAAHRATPCIARSLGQHALPTTFGARAAAWLDQLSEAADRLRSARAHLALQWGGAAGTSAALVDRAGGSDRARELTARLAARLGLSDAPVWHVARGRVTRLGSSLAEVVSAAGTLGADVVTGSRREIGELSEPAVPGRGGSSAMPHKRNPVLSVLLRSAAVAAPGHVATLYLAAGAAVDERPDGAWHAEWAALRELLRLTGGVASLVAELAAGLEVHPDRLRAHLDLALPDVAPDLAGADDAAVVAATGLAPQLADEAVARHRIRRAAAAPAPGASSPPGRTVTPGSPSTTAARPHSDDPDEES